MRETAAAAQRALLIQLVATLPLGAAVAALIAFLIARPIRQLDAAIRRLGEADLDRRVHVEGPADLAYLGERLDWLRRRLAALEHQKANFLRHVSHELKTPLTALREGAELLADGTAGPLAPQQREIVAIVRRAAGELARLIEALLDYQRAAASLASLELDRADLADIARRAVAPHALAAEARGVTIDLEAASAVIVADAEKLRVAVDNLVSNALKFSPRGGRVAVTVRPEGENAILEVTDEGPGVLPEDRERVFEWFFRGEEDRGGAVRGSGLGLAIARELVSAHGGRIEIVDEARPGAHFRVSLPVDGPRSEADGR
jgi:two-component system, NtrC family, sensor histidine kinase GlrK